MGRGRAGAVGDLRERRPLRTGFQRRLFHGVVSRPARQPPPLFDQPHRRRFPSTLNPQLSTIELFRLHLRLLGLRGAGGRENDEPRSLEKISRMGPAQFRVERPRPGGARFHLRRRVRLAAAAGEERARVRRGGARPADVLAIEGARHFPRGKRLRKTGGGRAAAGQAGRSFVRLDERDGLAAGEISRGRGKGNSLIGAENIATASCPATAGFSHQPRRTGVFENGVVEDRIAFGPASAFKSPAADIFYSTPYPSSRNRWSL